MGVRVANFVATAGPWLVAVVLLGSAILKTKNLEMFERHLAASSVLPNVSAKPLSVAVPLLEIIAFSLICRPETMKFGLYLAFFMLSTFSVYLATQLVWPSPVPCNCLGDLRFAKSVSADAAIGLCRNIVLLGLLVPAMSKRPVGHVYASSHSNSEVVSNRSGRAGFSITELLVVVCVVSLLLAILLPVLAGARSAARTSTCASNQKQIGISTHMWAATHRGYVPLDGEARVSDVDLIRTTGTPSLLFDNDRSRYAYFGTPGVSYLDGGFEVPIPFQVAILRSQLSEAQKGLMSPDTLWFKVENQITITRQLRCPDAREERLARSFSPLDSDGWPSLEFRDERNIAATWRYRSDYGTNGSLLSFHFDPATLTRFKRGNISKLKSSSEIMVLTDAFGGTFGSWVPSLASTSTNLTLSDVVDRSTEFSRAAILDRARHRRSTNVLSADGHVERVGLSELQRVKLLSPN